MTTSQTTNLHLTKAVKGTAEPFSIDSINGNLDILDEAVGDLQESVSLLNVVKAEIGKTGSQLVLRVYTEDGTGYAFAVYVNAPGQLEMYMKQNGVSSWSQIWSR